MMKDAVLVPDLLAKGLRIVFCGTAPSRTSAAARAYYAHPGNRFWPTLHEIGLTPKLVPAVNYEQLLSLRIGLTDLCKHHSGSDDELPAAGFDVEGLQAKILHYAPDWLVFTSLTAARIALGTSTVYGHQNIRWGTTQLYACCSTSGRARRFWQQHIWDAIPQLASDSSR
ncbi:mismatch-specific DNA-glycosylase [soil metagenome]